MIPRNFLWNAYLSYSVFESLISAVYWFPFYYTFKLIFTLWLALPQTGYVIHLLGGALSLTANQWCPARLPLLHPASLLSLLHKLWIDCSKPPLKGRLCYIGQDPVSC